MMNARKPCVPIKAALVLTLKSPPPVAMMDQAVRFPDSKPSAKITSLGVLIGVGVTVAVGGAVGVLDGMLV